MDSLIGAGAQGEEEEAEGPLSQSLPVAGFRSAVFMPTLPARLAVLHQRELRCPGGLSVLDVSMRASRYKTEILGKMFHPLLICAV